MVDLALLQSISYLAGALGVLAASAYYIWNIQNNNKQRRNEVVRTIIDRYSSYELMKVYMSAMEINYDACAKILSSLPPRRIYLQRQ